MRSGASWLSDLGMRVARLERDREGRPGPVAATQRVAAELEATAERRQLPEGGMARRAWLSGLARVKGKGNGTPGRKANKKDGRECCRADQDGHQQLVIAEGCSPQKMRYTRTRHFRLHQP
jgi:hypothetical protein